ncbi:hypothetical protein EDD11_000696 [Mortierella claussenii]|nr:hypothetical protein EDD11_000696 [Mortierella claussenii]
MDKLKDLLYGEAKPAPKRSPQSIQPHRCAKHVEDLMVAIANFEVQDQFSLVWQCMRSEKGTIKSIGLGQDKQANWSSNISDDHSQEPSRHSPPDVKPDHNV